MTRRDFRTHATSILKYLASGKDDMDVVTDKLFGSALDSHISVDNRNACVRVLGELGKGTPEGRTCACDILVGLVTETASTATVRG